MNIPKRLSCGFSLLELLFTLFIATVLICLSCSTLSWIYNKGKTRIIADEIKQAIHLAKLQALATSQIITLAPLTDNDWSTGMQLFTDNPSHHYVPTSILIREWNWMPRKAHVTWSGFESNSYIRFSPDLNERSCSGRFIVQSGEVKTIQLTVNRLARVKENYF